MKRIKIYIKPPTMYEIAQYIVHNIGTSNRSIDTLFIPQTFNWFNMI